MEKSNKNSRALADGPAEGLGGLRSWLCELGGEASAVDLLSKCLTMAAKAGDASLAKLLLMQGANPELGERPAWTEGLSKADFIENETDWTTPWVAAVNADSAGCLEAMIEAGMSAVKPRLLVDGVVEKEAFLAIAAAERGAELCFAMAMDFAARQAPEELDEITLKAWNTLVFSSNSAGKTEAMARALQQTGGDINEKSIGLRDRSRSVTPLERASHGDLEILRGLLAAGADPRAGRAVFFASQSSSRDSAACLSHLLIAGGDPNLSEEGVSALLGAIRTTSAEKARMLIESGARLDVGSSNGYGLLAEAAMRGSASCVGLLLNQGLDPDGLVEGTPLMEWVLKYRTQHGSAVSVAPENFQAIEIIKAASEAKALAKASGEAPKKMRSRRI